VTSSFESGAQRYARQNLQLERNLGALSASLEGREGYALGLAEALANDVGRDLRGRVEQRPREGFVAAAGESEGITHYNALKQVKDAVDAARAGNVTLPAGGIAFAEKAAVERVAEELAALDAAKRLLTAIPLLRIPRLEAFRLGAAEYVALVEPERPAAGERDGEGEGGRGAGRDWLLRRLPIALTVVAPLEAVQALLATVQRPGEAFEVASVKIERVDGDDVRAELELAALALVDANEAPASAKPRAAGADRRSTTRRRSVR
jgi:hypothetical protein